MSKEIEKIKLRYSINHFGTNSTLWNDLQKLLSHISTLEEEVKGLKNLFNGSEKINIKRTNEIVELKSRLKRLQEAVDKFKNSPIFFLSESKIYNYKRDEELYKVRDEV